MKKTMATIYSDNATTKELVLAVTVMAAIGFCIGICTIFIIAHDPVDLLLLFGGLGATTMVLVSFYVRFLSVTPKQ